MISGGLCFCNWGADLSDRAQLLIMWLWLYVFVQGENYQKKDMSCMVIGFIVAAIMIIAIVVVAGAKTA